MTDGHFVDDMNDPSGLGMFSKAGRYKTEQNIIFQRKDEILYGKKTIRPSQSLPSFQNVKKIQELATQKNQQGNNKIDENDPKAQAHHHNKEVTPFYKQLSREYIHVVKNPKVVSKPVGTYNPSYKQIDPNMKKIWDIKQVLDNHVERKQTPILLPADDTEEELKKFQQRFPHSKKPVPPYDNYEEEMTRQIPERVKYNIHGMIELKKSIDRPSQINVKGNPHENRFELLTYSTSWSNIRRTPSFFLDKRIGREVGGVYKEKEHQPDYNPNYEYSKKQFHNTGPIFSQRPSRKTLARQYSTNYEGFYDYDYYVKQRNKSHIFNTQKSFFFDKQLPREINGNSPLPSFMQKHVNQRANLTQLHHKMLEQNHFFDGRFQSTGSDFMKSQEKFMKKKQIDEDEESLELDAN